MRGWGGGAGCAACGCGAEEADAVVEGAAALYSRAGAMVERGSLADTSGFFGTGFLRGVSLALTGDGRDCRPRRCALPITALRLTPPSSSAIWLAVMPFSHMALS